jgi:hypothetical protein
MGKTANYELMSITVGMDREGSISQFGNGPPVAAGEQVGWMKDLQMASRVAATVGLRPHQAMKSGALRIGPG